jgi:hypothetical protein
MAHRPVPGGGEVLAECVELAQAPGVVAIRDSKNREGHMLLFAPTEVRQFVQAIKRGGHHL